MHLGWLCTRILWERVLKYDRENWEWRWRHIKISWSIIVNVQMLWLPTVTLSEIKGCGMGHSFCIKMMKRRTFQTCSSKQSIKKGHVFCLGKQKSFQLYRGRSRRPILPLATYLPITGMTLQNFYTRLMKWHATNIRLSYFNRKWWSILKSDF